MPNILQPLIFLDVACIYASKPFVATWNSELCKVLWLHPHFILFILGWELFFLIVFFLVSCYIHRNLNFVFVVCRFYWTVEVLWVLLLNFILCFSICTFWLLVVTLWNPFFHTFFRRFLQFPILCSAFWTLMWVLAFQKKLILFWCHFPFASFILLLKI